MRDARQRQRQRQREQKGEARVQGLVMRTADNHHQQDGIPLSVDTTLAEDLSVSYTLV